MSCKDCGPGGTRPAPHPGPRCATHHRLKLKERRAADHARHVLKTYGITAEQYQELYQFQGGKCAVCQVATGERIHLAVDHDHKCCPGPVSCGLCVRGLLCKSCNRTLGRFRDNPEQFRRAADYLEHWPMRRLGLVQSAWAASGSRSAGHGSSAAGARAWDGSGHVMSRGPDGNYPPRPDTDETVVWT